MAAAPDLEAAPLTVMFNHHQWVMLRGADTGHSTEVVRLLLAADLLMAHALDAQLEVQRVRYNQGSLAHHRGHSAYLFNYISLARQHSTAKIKAEQ